MKRYPTITTLVSLFCLTIILSACSLAEDVTPPPDAQSGSNALPTASTPQPVDIISTTATEIPLGASAANPLGTPQATAQGGNPQVNAGSIQGVITNGSGGKVPAGLLVTLHGYDAMQETYTKSTTAGADGKYAFPLVEMPSQRTFVITVTYQNVDYSSDVSTPTQAGQLISLPVSIYEPTTDKSALSIDRMHIFFDTSKADVVQVVELYVISNNGKQAVTAVKPGQPIIQFDLPKGANNLQIQDGTLGSDRYVKTDAGFGDTLTIPPGAEVRQVLFGFDLPYQKPFFISQPIAMAVKSAILMAPKGGKLTSPTTLTDGGDRDTEEMSFHIYSAADLPAGSQLDLTLVAENNAITNPWFDLTPTFYIGLGAIILALGVGAYWFFRQRKLRLAGAAGNPESAPVNGVNETFESQDAIIDAIAALDDLRQAGKLNESAYQQRRRELKQLLANRMKTDHD
jgi:hypothetical protein